MAFARSISLSGTVRKASLRIESHAVALEGVRSLKARCCTELKQQQLDEAGMSLYNFPGCSLCKTWIRRRGVTALE